MKAKKQIVVFFISFIFLLNDSLIAQQKNVMEVDVCIYGGSDAGVIAAYTAKKMGKSVLLIEPGRHLGSMSSGGLGYTDMGNKYAVTGLALDFYRRIGQHYGKFEQWIFEPKVAEALFQDYIKRGKVDVLYENRITGVSKAGNIIEEITLENSFEPNAATNKTVRAKMFIDCSLEGDLMARAGVSYTVGREANSQYNETYNGAQLMIGFGPGHQFPDGIDPYVVPGDPNSGLLWGINSGELQPAGSGDKKVQAYNFRICLTNVPENRIPITQPANYNPKKYELLIRLMNKKPWKTLNDGFIWSLMPNGKTDINNRNGFSTDMIGMNWDYPEADYATRKKIWNEHVDYTKGLLFFVGNDPRVPAHIREEMKKWGYPKDEYTDNDNWSHQLYVREARRMIGELVMTQHHCEGREIVSDGVGLAAYRMDSHNCDRLVVNNMVKNEGNVEEGDNGPNFGPYPISYRAITPKEKEAANLLVPVCLSATHIAYGSIRCEPVYMVMAQSAAVAACMAIDSRKSVQQIDVKRLQVSLKDNPLADGSVPEILVDNDNPETAKVTGTWVTKKKGAYGKTFYIKEAGQVGNNEVQYTPVIKKAGRYQAYAYFPKVEGASTKTHIEVFDGKQQKDIVVYNSDIKVLGQTRGEWVSLGTYSFSKGNQAYVRISDKEADGAIVADAVLFVPQK